MGELTGGRELQSDADVSAHFSVTVIHVDAVLTAHLIGLWTRIVARSFTGIFSLGGAVQL